ncbi:MAG: ATP-binding protein [Acidiferrobacterales bacterium]
MNTDPRRSGKIRALIRSTLRYKLLVLVLFPTLLAMPATFGLTLYWFNHFTRDNLLLKVKSDLALARAGLKQLEEEFGRALQRVADSHSLRTLLTAGSSVDLQKELHRLVVDEGFTFVHITNELGYWRFDRQTGPIQASKPTPLSGRAMSGRPATGLEVFSSEDLAREEPQLAERIRIPLAELAGDRSDVLGVANRAIVLRGVYPIKDANGKVLALLDGGVLLTGNAALIEELRDRVYGAGSLPESGLGAMAILLGDIRISTNFPVSADGGALGTRVTPAVREAVLGEGRVWASRDRVGDQWYIAAYGPLFDVDGRGVGMLQTGFLEAPFRHAFYRAAAGLLLIFIALIAFSTWIVLRGARAIFRPIEQMAAVVRATQAGLDKRIGQVDSQDEIGELARQFDAMLDLLQQRNREIQRAANELELKVEERTRELERKNTDLERTVNLLRETRQQLVTAEKLASLGEMAAGIAHEINNPTAVILGHLDLLAAELGAAADVVQGDIEMIMQQVERIRYIVDSLLQFAKPLPSADEAELEHVDVNRTVRDTLPLVRYAIEKSSTEVRAHLKATRSVRIQRYELQEVLINLILNAVRATASGGTINVTVQDWDQHGVVISVKDDGVGIAHDIVGRIFDPFFTTDAKHGTGLGLSVSYGLIRRYGGEITVESEPGSGTVFHLWLLEEPLLADDIAPLEFSRRG